MLPAEIPLFPLPNVVLFPGMPLPLHVFEERYRKMVRDVLTSHRTIGMALLRPGWEAGYEGRPAVYEIGCAGLMERCDPLADGRFNIMLRGVSRFRILGERADEPYRIAAIAPVADEPGDEGQLQRLRARLLKTIGQAMDGPAVLVTQPEVKHADFVNALCQSLALEPVERQSLLDCPSLEARAERLVEILEWKALEHSHGGPRGETVH
jgi:uncharacterized protein